MKNRAYLEESVHLVGLFTQCQFYCIPEHGSVILHETYIYRISRSVYDIWKFVVQGLKGF